MKTATRFALFVFCSVLGLAQSQAVVDTVVGATGNVVLKGAPGADYHPVLDASNSTQTAFEIVKNGTIYSHMVLTDTIKGIGFFNVYLALENSPTSIDPQLRWYNSPIYGQAVIQAYHSTNPTYKYALNLGASGKIYLNPTNGDPIVCLGPVIIPTHTPSSATDTGTTGQIGWDANYFYVCVATNTWVRTALATW